MKHKLLALLLSCVMLFSLLPTVSAAAAPDDMARWGAAAEALWNDGLFLGSGSSFDLDKPLTRAAGVTMVVRLLGVEAEAKAGKWTTPFTDVPAWAAPYVGYAYTKGITQGTSATTFGTDAPMNADQFLTLTLRALGYDDKAGDFSWDKAADKALEIGLVAQADLTNDFLRGHAALVSYNALSQKLKGTDKTLKSTITVPGKPSGAMPTWTAPVDEYARGVGYNFVPGGAKDKNAPVTEKELTDMLTAMISNDKSAALPQWTAFAGKASGQRTVARDYGAMLLLKAAELTGNTDFSRLHALYYGNQVDWDAQWAMFTNSYPLFGDGWAENCKAIADQMGETHMDYRYAALTWVSDRISLVSGAPLLDRDGKMSLRANQPMTYGEAVTAVVRLYESNADAADKVVEAPEAAAAAQAALDAASARRAAILNSKTAIVKSSTFTPGETYTGTAYYVSNTGNDANNGTSPESAWATVEQVNRMEIKQGDAVFFERGGLWRAAQVETRPGVTYSAYGEGTKPRFYGSPENGGGAANWTLYGQSADGGKIWVYGKDMPDCGAVVLGNGKAVAEKVLGFWNGTEFLTYTGLTKGGSDQFSGEKQLSAPVFDVKAQLNRDLTFFSQADSTLPDSLPVYLSGYGGNDYAKTAQGTLYLRCDAGNPGEIYSSIEFLTPTAAFDGLADGCVLDNLFIGYTGYGGINVGQNKSNDNTTIQNCEVAWCGGTLLSYALDGRMGYMPGIQRAGGGINGGGASGTRILNNYVHETYQEGVGIEAISDAAETFRAVKEVYISGNLLYHCSSGLFLIDREKDDAHNRTFEDCVLEDNYVLYTGMNAWGDVGDRSITPSFVNEGGGDMGNKTCAVRNNVFFVGDTALVWLQASAARFIPKFEGNTYIQWSARPFLWNEEVDYYPSTVALDAIRNDLGDGTGVVYPLIHLNRVDPKW